MNIVTAKEMYEIDRIAIEEKGLSGTILMENAGRAMAELLMNQINKETKIVVLVGSGNNGGDGFVLARTLVNLGYQVETIQVVANERIQGDARFHKEIFLQYGCPLTLFEKIEASKEAILTADLIVDALLGVGVTGKLRAPYNQIIPLVNQAKSRIVSIDLPSGVPAETSEAFEMAVKADQTYIVEVPKLSAFIERYAEYYGKWKTVSIGLPKDGFDQVKTRRTWEGTDIVTTLPARNRFSHKGKHGKGLVIGGSALMPGSIAMTAKAALRAGAGLLTVATVPEAISSVAAHITETTFHSLSEKSGVITGGTDLNYADYDAIVIGMGMGRASDTQQFTQRVVAEANVPLLIDADGLYHIRNDLDMLKARTAPTILTPHPGEMATILGCSVQDVLENPFACAERFAKTYQVHLLLKGAYTIVTDPVGDQFVNVTGNEGLAKGGSGDCLAGVILAMVMQEQPLTAAISNSCYIHGKAAELLVENEHSTYDLLATDVIEAIPLVFRTFFS